MDVRAHTLAFALGCIILSACSPKTSSSVFDETALGSSACRGQALSTQYIVQWEDGRFSVERAASVEQFKEKFLKPNLENIRKVEYDHTVTIEKPVEGFASDSLEAQSISLGTQDTWGQTMVGAGAVWEQGVYGNGVLVGVVDSFVDTSHPQLAPRIAVNIREIPNNGIDDDGNGYVDDYYGYNFIANPNSEGKVSDHGSHVAGIIAADHQTGVVRGMAPKAKLIPAPFIDAVNPGTIGSAILAMQYVSSRGAKIINASWGGGNACTKSLLNAFYELDAKGILVVVAAGNAGDDIDYKPTYPASFNMPNQITVAAATASDIMASWSNNGFGLVHLAAPGDMILSTITNNRTAYNSGTSMAAPFVSGAAALLWSDRPQATPYQIKKALLTSVDVTPGQEYRVQTLGRMNVSKALAALRKMLP